MTNLLEQFSAISDGHSTCRPRRRPGTGGLDMAQIAEARLRQLPCARAVSRALRDDFGRQPGTSVAVIARLANRLGIPLTNRGGRPKRPSSPGI